MGLSLSTSGGNNGSSVTNLALTITIPANAAVGLLANFKTGGAFVGYSAGTCTDTGGNTYTSAGGGSFGPVLICDALYCLNTGSSATSLTYTCNSTYTSGGVNSLNIVGWVWTATGGTVTYGSQSNNGQSAPGTGTDAITSGSVNCAAGSVVMGLSLTNGGSGPVSSGTGFTSDYSAFSVLVGEHGAFNANQAATWTTGDGTNPTLSNAISFGFNSGNVAVIAWVT